MPVSESLATELDRILAAKGALRLAITDRGGSLPQNARLDAYASAVEALPVGTPGDRADILAAGIASTDVRVGDTVTLTVTATGDPAPALSYQWLRNTVAITGATGPAYTATPDDIGPETLACRITATNLLGGVDYSAQRTTAPVSVAAADTAPAAFAGAQWSLETASAGAVVQIAALPEDGGQPISALEYRLNAGPAAGLGGATPDAYPVAGAEGDAVQIRAVNAIGAGTWSDARQLPAATVAAVLSNLVLDTASAPPELRVDTDQAGQLHWMTGPEAFRSAGQVRDGIGAEDRGSVPVGSGNTEATLVLEATAAGVARHVHVVLETDAGFSNVLSADFMLAEGGGGVELDPLTQFRTDFSDYAGADILASADWSSGQDAPPLRIVEETGMGFGYRLALGSDQNNWRAVRWLRVPPATDADIVWLMQSSFAPNDNNPFAGVFARGSFPSSRGGNAALVGGANSGDALSGFLARAAGASGVNDWINEPHGVDPLELTWYRFQVSGGTRRLKIWQADPDAADRGFANQPAAWLLEAGDADALLATAGGVGLHTRRISGNAEINTNWFYFLGVGIDGAPAPGPDM